MKKLMILAALAATSLAAIADRTAAEIRAEAASINAQDASLQERAANRRVFQRGITEAEWRVYLDDFLAFAATNAMPAGAHVNFALRKYANMDFVNVLGLAKGLPFDSRALCAEYDERIAATGFASSLPPLAAWPKTAAEFRARAKWRELMPTMDAEADAALAAGCDKVNYGKAAFSRYLACIAELAAYSRDEWGCKFQGMNEKFVIGACANLSKKALPVVKRAIRASGKSFVAKEGEENPVEAPLNALTSALNAPRFAGLVEWCDKWCPDASAAAAKLVASLPSEAEIVQMKDGVFVGELAFSSARRAYLRMCLGVEAFNAFVKEYNGD